MIRSPINQLIQYRNQWVALEGYGIFNLWRHRRIQLRLISPSDSKDFKVELNTFGEISGNARDISLNRRQRYSPSIEIISKPHFVLKWHNTLRMGQWPMSEYFFIESVIYFNLSISNTNSEVTIYHPCKFLHIIFSIYNFALSKS